MISICIPIYKGMPNWKFYLDRCLNSIKQQTFTDYEIVMTERGKMAENTNAAIKEAKGDLIKILYQDDYLTHKDSLKNIVENFRGEWLVTGCNHTDGVTFSAEHLPTWNSAMLNGINTIGSPSVITIKNKTPLLFDENLDWLLDCDYYYRMKEKYGLPIFLNDINITIGLGEHQATNLMGYEIKIKEQKYLYEKYSSFTS